MAEVLRLKLNPIVRVERFGGLWVASVRPCPEGVQPDRSFGSADGAAEYATALKQAHGWRIRPDCYDRSLPGVA
jgi:hypothetical protein